MNFMSMVLDEKEVSKRDKKLIKKVEELKELVKKEHIKINKSLKRLGKSTYCLNSMPYIPKSRDVLIKPSEVCSIRVNWKKKSFEGMSTDDIIKELKVQWCWYTAIVDEEHSRNKYKNKDTICVVFDSEEKAKKYMNVFNKLFMTAIEKDCVEEYKKFKLNPDKRILSFDKLVNNAYELYEAVDKGEL